MRCYSDSSCANVLSIHLRFSISNDDLLSNVYLQLYAAVQFQCVLSLSTTAYDSRLSVTEGRGGHRAVET